ncbi:MAG: PGF-pre-PGF domain-containing protein, partial [bacterium]
NALINWTITETNLIFTNISLDNNQFYNISTSNNPEFNYTNLATGLHTIKINAIDLANNRLQTVSTYYFKINKPLNITRTLTTLNSSAGNEVKAIELTSPQNENISTNESANMYITLTMKLNVSTSKQNISVRIPNFNGLETNWNKTFVVNTSLLKANRTAENKLGTKIERLLFLTGFENFINNESYDSPEIEFDINITQASLEIVYFSDDDATNATEVTEICDSTTTPCYIVNETDKTIVRIPHFSGAALTNDTVAPKIEIQYPENNTIVPTGYRFNFTIYVNESNYPTCNYSINNNTETEISLDTTDNNKHNFTFVNTTANAVMNNSQYNLTINCYDDKGNSISNTHNFTITDTTNPILSGLSETLTDTTATITATANEPVNFTINHGTTSALGTNTTQTTYSTSISKQLTGLTLEDTYYYNITICDKRGNCLTNGTNSFTTESTAEEEEEEDDDSETTSTTSDTSSGSNSVTLSKTQVWSTMTPGDKIMRITSLSIPFKKITMVVNQQHNNVKIEAINLEKNKPANINEKSNTYNYLELKKTNLPSGSLDKAIIEFQVPLQWIKNISVQNTDIRLYRYLNNKWTELPTTYLGTESIFAKYSAETPGFSYFTIAAIKQIPQNISTTKIQEQQQQQYTTTTTQETPTTTTTSTTIEKESQSKGAWKTVLLTLLLVIICGGAGYAIYYFKKQEENKSENNK